MNLKHFEDLILRYFLMKQESSKGSHHSSEITINYQFVDFNGGRRNTDETETKGHENEPLSPE